MINQTSQKRHEAGGTISGNDVRSGGWLLQSSTYQGWRDSRSSSVLWLHGTSGSGKSILARTVIENLQQKTDPVAWLFFGRFNVEYSEIHLLRALSAALLRQRPQTAYEDQLGGFLANLEHRGAHIPLRQFQKYLRQMLETFAAKEHVFLVLDGLDDWHWTKTRILDVLWETTFQSQNRVRISCMICSRIACGATVRDVRLNVMDINLDTNQSVRDEVGMLITNSLRQMTIKYPSRHADLANIEAELKKTGRSNFLWTSLILDEIARVLASPARLSHALIRALPSTLKGVYQRILSSVFFNRKCNPQAARLVFAWATYATRPLQVPELIEAFSTRAPTVIPASQLFYESGGRELLKEEALYAIAGGLLTVKNKDTLKFIHRSAEEFCANGGLKAAAFGSQLDPSHAHEYLAQVCLQYLLDQGKVQLLISGIDEKNKATTEASRARNPFLDYAVESWSRHYKIAEAHSIYLPGMLQHCLMKVQWESRPDHKICKSKISGIFALCVQLGFAKLGQVCIDLGVDINDNIKEASHQRCETPLQAASANGHLNLVALLINKRAHINAPSGSGLTPLHLAAFKGHYKVCRLLLSSGAEKNARTREGGETPLHLAVAERHKEIVQILLAAGAHRNLSTTTSGKTPIHTAAEVGDPEICAMLLSGYPAIDHSSGKTWDQLLQLHMAASQGKLAQETRRVDPSYNHADESFDNCGWTWCRGMFEQSGSITSISLMRMPDEKQRAYPNKQPTFSNDEVSTCFKPITHRTKTFGEVSAKLTPEQPRGPRIGVPDYCINLRVKNRAGWTALHIAAARGYWDVCELLLAYGGNPYEPTSSGRTAIQLAIEHKINHGKYEDLHLERAIPAQNITNSQDNYYGPSCEHRVDALYLVSDEELEDDWIVVGKVSADN